MSENEREARFTNYFRQLPKESKEYVLDVILSMSKAQSFGSQALSGSARLPGAKAPELSPSGEELKELIGAGRFSLWNKVCYLVENLYNSESAWKSGGKKWKYEYKYRRGGRTLCALYAKKEGAGFMVVLGKAERAEFEKERAGFTEAVRKLYDEAAAYHDGKWVMVPLDKAARLADIEKLLRIKRK